MVLKTRLFSKQTLTPRTPKFHLHKFVHKNCRKNGHEDYYTSCPSFSPLWPL